MKRHLVSADEAALLLGIDVPQARGLLREHGVLPESDGAEVWYEAQGVCTVLALIERVGTRCRGGLAEDDSSVAA